MRYALPFVALLTCTTVAVAGETDGKQPFTPLLDNPVIRELQAPLGPGETVCRDMIHAVRGERGLPVPQRGTADPDDPLFIAAVDKRIDGCSVMVMRNDLSDVRPLPKPDNQTTLRPAQ